VLLFEFGEVQLFCHLTMDLSPCCFCQKSFKKLGAHYRSCPERNGEDYEHLLSVKTRYNRQKSQKSPCPNCGKFFLRLDTHLKNSAICKEVPQIPHTPVPSPAVGQPCTPSAPSNTSPTASPVSVRSSPQTLPTPDIPPLTTLPSPKLPTSPEEWAEADLHFKTTLVPAVRAGYDVDDMNHVLCHGIYQYMASTHGIKPVPRKRHQL